MKNRWIWNVVLVSLLLLLLSPAVSAAGASGSCGEGLTWTLENYTLTVTGSGEMEDGCPWADYKTKIENVVLTGGVTKVGADNFSGCDRLETVDFGDALVEIGDKAFYGCEDIVYIHLPKTFRTFGAQSFRGCESLQSVYCDGGMPRFNDSCLWTGNYIAVFYPTNNPWPSEYTAPLISSYGGNLGIMMGNFDAANLPQKDSGTSETEAAETTEQTEPVAVAALAETEPAVAAQPTQPETVPTTVPETTEAITVPTTEETKEPTTEATTEETTVETTVETTEETEPVNPVEKVGGDGWIGVLIVAGVLTMLLAGAMIFRGMSRRGGRY
ncbi:MAG: leucine-rich repeat domain-containing protein [Faecousia sp.]